MKNRITEAYCYYTGGGIYVYSAKYGDVFLYGTLDQYICCYTVRGEILYQDEDICKAFGWTDEMNAFRMTEPEDSYYVSHDEIEYPTWSDILKSLKQLSCSGSAPADMEETLRYWNSDLSKHTDED